MFSISVLGLVALAFLPFLYTLLYICACARVLRGVFSSTVPNSIFHYNNCYIRFYFFSNACQIRFVAFRFII